MAMLQKRLSREVFRHETPKSSDMYAKNPLPEKILLNFGFVSVRVLDRYEIS